MRRSVVSFLVAALFLLASCSRSTPLPEYEVTSGAPGSVGDSTYQVVLLGPASSPVASGDDAPRLFNEEPSVRRELETSLPASLLDGQGQTGSHLILSVAVVGAVETEDGVEVYADVWEAPYSLAGWQPIEIGGALFPARIRLARDGDGLRLAGVDVPEEGEGYVSSLNAMLPRWARRLVGTENTRKQMQDAIWDAARAWATPHVPADLFVEQEPPVVPDPHGHAPPSSSHRMLASRYIDCELVRISPPGQDDYQEEFAIASEDGRLRLHYLLTGSMPVAVEDVRTGEWRGIRAPGDPLGAVSGTVGFDPVWVGHTLFIDFDTVVDPYRPTFTHYEIDWDSLTAVRAVPMGPLSFNQPAGL